MRAVAVVVPGRREFARSQPDDGVIGGHLAIGADELVVARECRAWVAAAGELTGARAIRGHGRCRIGLPRWIGIRERRVLGPDARVEDADDDALAGTLLAAKRGPDSRRSDELRADVGFRVQEHVR